MFLYSASKLWFRETKRIFWYFKNLLSKKIFNMTFLSRRKCEETQSLLYGIFNTIFSCKHTHTQSRCFGMRKKDGEKWVDSTRAGREWGGAYLKKTKMGFKQSIKKQKNLQIYFYTFSFFTSHISVSVFYAKPCTKKNVAIVITCLWLLLYSAIN